MKTLLQSVLINCGKACLTDSNTNAAIGNIAKVMGSELCVVKPLYKKSCVECWAFLSNVTAFIDQWFSRTHQLVLKKKKSNFLFVCVSCRLMSLFIFSSSSNAALWWTDSSSSPVSSPSSSSGRRQSDMGSCSCV